MAFQASLSSMIAVALCTLFSVVHAHTVFTYPGWRGDNLLSNGTVADTRGLQPYNAGNGSLFPYGMQWTYPCGGMPISQNRTKWPVKGGAVAFQPGWFQGHATAYIYINLGIGNTPTNYSNVMYSGLQISGPSGMAYPGTFCIPQVPLPANQTFKVGDNATIQLIEQAVHGAALYNCVDITFADPADVVEVTRDNCFNSSQIRANLVYATPEINSGAVPSISLSRSTALTALVATAFIYALF